jgi:hypothetical protein
MQLIRIKYFSRREKTMKKIFYIIIFLFYSNQLFSQDDINLIGKNMTDIDIVFSIFDMSNDTIVTENRISALLDSLTALSVHGSKELSVLDKTNSTNVIKKRNGEMIYSIGDRAQGGIVFWVDEKGHHGLVASEADQGEGETWYEGKTFSLKDGIFAGKFNTERIIANKSLTYNAAQACANYKGGGYDDWYLPSKLELRLLYNHKSLIGVYAKDYYWSSTEEENDVAWLLSFYDGFDSNYINYGSSLFRVRAIRAF